MQNALHLTQLIEQYERIFPHECRIYRRPVIGPPTPMDEPSLGELAPIGVPIHCWLWSTTIGGQETANARQISRYSYEVALPLGTDVTEHDAIGDVTLRGDGSYIIHSGPLYVREITRLMRSLVVTVYERTA